MTKNDYVWSKQSNTCGRRRLRQHPISIEMCDNYSFPSTRLHCLFESFVSRDIVILLRAYTTYVRPILEFNTVVWSPSLKCDILVLKRYKGNLLSAYQAMAILAMPSDVLS